MKKLLSNSVSLLFIMHFVTGIAYGASSVVVTGNSAGAENQPGWLFNRDLSTSTPFVFNTNEASIGFGSLYILPIGSTPANKMVAENFVNTPVEDVNAISYDFLIGSGGSLTDSDQFYMNVYANFGESDDLKYYDCRYNIIPSEGSMTNFTTVEFDPTKSYSVTTRGSSPYTCPSVPADMNSLSSGSNIRMFALNVGDTSANDVGLDGYLDNVVVNTIAGETIYDFDPLITKENCKKGGWMSFSNPLFKNQGHCVSYVQTR